jgi:arsenical pump membrane protein
MIARSVLRAPLDVIPFVLSMFVLVLALNKVGATAKLAELLSGRWEVFSYGIASLFAANLVNNIPMSVLFSSVTSASSAGAGALYAAVIGSNIGAFLTPVGALAGIMWMAMLKEQGVKLSFGRFVLYGASVAIPTALSALIGLVLVI